MKLVTNKYTGDVGLFIENTLDDGCSLNWKRITVLVLGAYDKSAYPKPFIALQNWDEDVCQIEDVKKNPYIENGVEVLASRICGLIKDGEKFRQIKEALGIK